MKVRLWLLILFMIPLASSIEPQFIYEIDTNPDLLVTCTNSLLDEPCNSDFTCNLNINYPNGTALFNDTGTTRVGDGLYSLELQNISTTGFYPYNSVCTNGSNTGVSRDLYFRVTESGQVFSEAQGLGGLGIIFSVIALAFFFMILGFKFSGNSKTLPLTLFFVVIGIFLVIYSLQLGLQFSVDIMEYQGLADVQTAIYIGILYLVGGIGIISFILMSVAFVRAFGEEKKIKSFGEGFDPISQTYI